MLFEIRPRSHHLTLLRDSEPVDDIFKAPLRENVEPFQRLVRTAEDAMHRVSWDEQHAALGHMVSDAIDLHRTRPLKHVIHLGLGVLMECEHAIVRTGRDPRAHGVRAGVGLGE